MRKVNRGKDMREEYNKEDLGAGKRGKFYKKYNQSNNIVLLKPEEAKVFPTEDAVNDALLSLIKVSKAATGKKKSLHKTP
ncbi:MAG: hypothetical protein FP816_01855 [Desulfobacteraceae bacterium]|nr:hypothetical protein [Desulfobacteraceae bacterium]